MKKLLAAAAAVSLLAIAAPASAGVYGSLGYSQLDFGGAIDTEFQAVTGRLGWGDDAQWWGAEADLSLGIGDEDYPGGEVKLQSDLAVFAVAHFDVAESFTVFARVGYGVTRVKDTPGVDVDADGPAYGVGAQFNFAESDAIRFDYTHRDTDEDFGESASMLTVSYVRRFR